MNNASPEIREQCDFLLDWMQDRIEQLLLEELLSELKVEVYADKDAYIDSDGEQWYSGDDDDGYAD